MSARFAKFGFGSKRKSNSPNVNGGGGIPQIPTPPPPVPQLPSAVNGNPIQPHVSEADSSVASLPMNHQQHGLGRPPSYDYQPGAGAQRATSPMPPGQHLAPINAGGYGQHSAMAGQQPPQYGGGYQPQGTLGHYQGRPAEVEGGGRSKAQLIVGIDFVRITPC